MNTNIGDRIRECVCIEGITFTQDGPTGQLMTIHKCAPIARLSESDYIVLGFTEDQLPIIELKEIKLSGRHFGCCRSWIRIHQ